MISVWEDCHSLLNFGKKEEVWGILTGQEVAILGADQKERRLWGQECGLPSPRREERGLLSRTAAGNRAYHDLDTRRRRTIHLCYLPQQHFRHYQTHFIPFSNIYLSFSLDVKISLSQFGKVETDLYTKPTDKDQYVLQSSCHPLHTSHSIYPHSLITTHMLFRRKLHITHQWAHLILN